MINIGKINTLKIVKKAGTEIHLESGKPSKVLLVDKNPPEHYEPGDTLTVFVYLNSEGHAVATSQIPLALVDDIAWLKVVALNYVGAFLDWGLPKNLLVPFSEQHHELEVGKSYLVKVFLDDQNRLAATTKIDQFITDISVDFVAGQQVSLLITDTSELGVKAIINNTHWGVLYQNEIFQPLKKGQKLTGYIKQIREDQKIDLVLDQPGYGKVLSLTDSILIRLNRNNGVLMLSDKSPPEAIYAVFGVSKKVFKQAIGALYRQKLITIDDKEGIKLVKTVNV
jgi:uncharacterized protein